MNFAILGAIRSLRGFVQGPFSVDATSHATAVANAGVTTLTWAHTCGASATKLVVLATGAKSGVSTDRNITGVTYNSVALSFVGGQDDANFCNVEIWKLDSPTTGSSQNIVVTYGATLVDQTGGAASFNGTSNTDGAPTGATNTTDNPSVTVADTASGDIVVSVLLSDIGPVGATTEAGTLIWEDEDVDSDCDSNAQYQTATGANTVCSWTSASGGNRWAAVGAAIKPA